MEFKLNSMSTFQLTSKVMYKMKWSLAPHGVWIGSENHEMAAKQPYVVYYSLLKFHSLAVVAHIIR